MSECQRLCEIANTRFTDMEKRYDDRFQAQMDALNRSERILDSKFESVNEFRALVTDIQTNNVTRNEWSIQHQNLENRLNDIINRVTRMEGSGSGKTAFWGYLVGGIGTLSLIVTLIHLLVAK